MKNSYKIRFSIAIAVFVLAIAAFVGLYPIKLLDLQFAPILQRVFVDFSFAALAILLAILVITALFGRFYCSTICPFGIFQEIVAALFKRKTKYTPNYPVKYFIAAITFGILAGGSAVALRFIEPYTLFGSAISLSALGIIAILAVLAIVFFKNRFFCTNICPVGVLLGLISKFSLNKIRINQSACVFAECARKTAHRVV